MIRRSPHRLHQNRIRDALLAGDQLRVASCVLLALLVFATQASARNEPYAVDDPAIVAPTRIEGDPPVYPPDARASCAEGKVRLKALVSQDGEVEDVEITFDPGHDLAQAAREAVASWTYQPGVEKKTRRPVKAWAAVQSTFEDPCQEAPPTIYRIDEDGVSAPRKIYSPVPRYTEIACKARIRGIVILEAIISDEGIVRSVKVLKGLPMGLSEAAVHTVRTWRFEPARLDDGTPVAVLYTLTVNYALPRDVDCGDFKVFEVKPIATPWPDVGDLKGLVTVVLNISRDGEIKNVKIAAASSDELAKAVKEGLKAWRYEPPIDPDTGRRIRATTTVNLGFPSAVAAED